MNSNRYIIIIALIGFVLSISTYIRDYLGYYFPSEIVYTVLAALLANSFFKDITNFLKRRDELSFEVSGDTNIQHNYTFTKDETRELINEELAKIRSSLTEGEVKENDIDEIVSQLRESVFSQTSDDVLKIITKKIEGNNRSDEIKERIERTIRRLSIEIQNLTNRSSLNLTIGVIISILGFAALAYFVFTYASETKTPSEMAAYFLPRASLVIFVEVFAYFFLRLYKDTLSEIKYFQNELTNVELKYISLGIALSSGNEDLVKEVVSGLAKTERNFILNKGQSTVELENTRSENSAIVDSIKLVSSVFNGKAK